MGVEGRVTLKVNIGAMGQLKRINTKGTQIFLRDTSRAFKRCTWPMGYAGEYQTIVRFSLAEGVSLQPAKSK